MNRLSEQGERLDHEGTMMRTMMAANGYWVPSSISEEELGKVFDFDGGRQYIKIEFPSEVRQRIDRLHDPNDNYGKSLFTDPFKIEAVKALAAGGEVDFNYRIIKDSTFIGTKADCVYEKLKSHNGNLFRSTIGKFIDNPKYDLKFTTSGNCGDGDTACTDAQQVDVTGTIKIIIKDVYQPNLELAATLLHEGIHAELFRYISQYKDTGINPNDNKEVFRYYKYYAEKYGDPFNDDWAKGKIDHIYMTQYYIEPIARALREIDVNKYPLDYYKGFAWDGLRAWDPNNTLGMDPSSPNFENYRKIVNENSNLCK